MSRRCPNRHHVPPRATFCPQCWALLPPPRPRVRRRVFWPVVIAGLFVLMSAGWWLFQALTEASRPGGPVARAQQVLPAVFTVHVMDSLDLIESQGSAFLVDSAGRAVTAYHVLRGARRAVAWFGDGRMFEVLSVAGWDSLADVAVFEVGRSGRSGIRHPRPGAYARLRARSRAVVGEPVVVVGTPEGFENTLSDGLVSGTRVSEHGERIQLTAPVSSGSSGGPVFDARGQVIGVVVSRIEEGQNLNFASPVSALGPLLEAGEKLPLAEFGERTREHVPEYDPLAQELFLIGNDHFAHKRYAAALERYRLAMEADSSHSGAVYNAALCLLNLGREDEAEPYLRQFLRQEHDEDEFHRHAVEWLQKRAAQVK